MKNIIKINVLVFTLLAYTGCTQLSIKTDAYNGPDHEIKALKTKMSEFQGTFNSIKTEDKSLAITILSNIKISDCNFTTADNNKCKQQVHQSKDNILKLEKKVTRYIAKIEKN